MIWHLKPLSTLATREPWERGLSQGTDSFLAKMLNLVDRGAKVSKRLRWAVIDPKNFANLVEKLIGHNDLMESLLDRHAVKSLQSAQYETHMITMQLNSKMDDLMVICSALDINAEKRLPLANAESLRSDSSRPIYELRNESLKKISIF